LLAEGGVFATHTTSGGGGGGGTSGMNSPTVPSTSSVHGGVIGVGVASSGAVHKGPQHIPLLSQLTPIKVLFGCLYFTHVGMSLSLTAIWHNVFLVLLLVCAISLGKLFVSLAVFVPALHLASGLRLSLATAHTGELALVLLSRALSEGLISYRAHALFGGAVVVSLGFAPLWFSLPSWRHPPVTHGHQHSEEENP